MSDDAVVQRVEGDEREYVRLQPSHRFVCTYIYDGERRRCRKRAHWLAQWKGWGASLRTGRFCDEHRPAIRQTHKEGGNEL